MCGSIQRKKYWTRIETSDMDMETIMGTKKKKETHLGMLAYIYTYYIIWYSINIYIYLIYHIYNYIIYNIYIYIIYHIYIYHIYISYIYIIYIIYIIDIIDIPYISKVYIICFYEFQWRATKTGTPKKIVAANVRASARLACSSPVFGLQAPAGTCRTPLVMTDSVRTGKWWFNGIL